MVALTAEALSTTLAEAECLRVRAVHKDPALQLQVLQEMPVTMEPSSMAAEGVAAEAAMSLATVAMEALVVMVAEAAEAEVVVLPTVATVAMVAQVKSSSGASRPILIL